MIVYTFVNHPHPNAVWSAAFRGEEEPVGYGATPKDALEDLFFNDEHARARYEEHRSKALIEALEAVQEQLKLAGEAKAFSAIAQHLGAAHAMVAGVIARHA